MVSSCLPCSHSSHQGTSLPFASVHCPACRRFFLSFCRWRASSSVAILTVGRPACASTSMTFPCSSTVRAYPAGMKSLKGMMTTPGGIGGNGGKSVLLCWLALSGCMLRVRGNVVGGQRGSCRGSVVDGGHSRRGLAGLGWWISSRRSRRTSQSDSRPSFPWTDQVL